MFNSLNWFKKDSLGHTGGVNIESKFLKLLKKLNVYVIKIFTCISGI